MAEGYFLTIEGIDGVGKSTQAQHLCNALRQHGHSVIHTREPGGTRIGQRIRDLLLDPLLEEFDPQTEILLYAADRAQHTAEVITPALRTGHWVVCERYVDSSIAYQGYGLGWDQRAIAEINAWAVQGSTPDLTLCLDQEPRSSLERAGRDRIEQRTLGYYQRVRQGFLAIAEEHNQRCVVIDAEGTIAEVHARMWDAVQRRLNV